MHRRTVELIGAVVGSVLFGAATSATHAWQAAGDVPRFEAVSVKPCDPNADAGGVRGGARPSPNRLFVPCLPVRAIVRLAFLAGQQNPRDRERLVGGPDWLDSERFTIEAVADPAIPRATVSGPMFQAVLVERFGLKVRRETRPVRAYALSIAPRQATLAALREDDCVQKPSPQPARPRKPDCDLVTRAAIDPPLTLSRLLERTGQGWFETRGNDRVYHALPITMDAFVLFLDSILDRPVTNGTGLKGLFDIRLEFSPEGTIPTVDPALLAADPPRAPSLFTALQEQLGLRLEPNEAPSEFVVIESIDRPKPN
jgi:uncharacterized protein (TIGR03435 family)